MPSTMEMERVIAELKEGNAERVNDYETGTGSI